MIVVWQSISVAVFSLPLALLAWKPPTLGEWFTFLLCGLLGSLGHYLLTRSFTVADISATQSVKFLDLVWASLLGWLVFADTPSRSTLIGGVVICASTLWIARREARAHGALTRPRVQACRSSNAAVPSPGAPLQLPAAAMKSVQRRPVRQSTPMLRRGARIMAARRW